MIRIQDEKYFNTRWMFEVGYSGILPCPNCRISLAAYLQYASTLPYSYDKPRIIYLEFGTHRDAVNVLSSISQQLVGESFATPTYYQYGTAFVGRRDVSQYKALIRGDEL